MKSLLSLAAVLVLAAARPETYKETEDFQYSRSSSDEGSKSGFYGAQRGNVGGNYERAHNMDGLAQHQLSSAVRQVDGELGEASKMRTGSVFTAANSGGMFGSGHYDVSNLHGRNFQETGSYGAGGSHSHSSLSSHQAGYQDQLSSSMHGSGFDSSSHNSGYRHQGTKTGQTSSQMGNLQTAESMHDGSYDFGTHGAATGQSSGHSSQSGYQSQSTYGSSDASQHSSQGVYQTHPQSRLIYTPVRIVGRPGTRVAVPLSVQTYDATHSASTQEQNAFNSETELLASRVDQQHISHRPTANAKHFESGYSYQKQWERHDGQPETIAVVVPTENPFPKNSELYEDAQTSHSQHHASGYDSQAGYSSQTHNAYNTKSSSAIRAHQSAASQVAGSSNANSHGAYTGASIDEANAINGIETKPKSYQSAYSYHKSWERQGDPYVIKPVGEVQTGEDLQRLTAASKNHMSSYQSSADQTHQSYSQGSSGYGECCVPGYRRVARSIRSQGEDLGQQVQQTQRENLEDFQSSWDKYGDSRRTGEQYGETQQLQTQWKNYVDDGQHAFNSRQMQGTQGKKWGKLEDLGQVQQNTWENMDQIQQREHIPIAWPEHTFGMQTFENPEQQTNSFQSALTSATLEQQESHNFESAWRPVSSEKTEGQQQQINNFDVAWKPESFSFPQTKHDEQQETKQIFSSDFNQEQQSSSSTWQSQVQQEIQTNMFKNQSSHKYNTSGFDLDQIYLQPQEYEESDQQASRPLGIFENSDQYKQDQQQVVQEPSLWPSTSDRGHSINIPSVNSYKKQEEQSQINTQISNIWDKISQVDGMSLGTDNYHQIRKEQENVNQTLKHEGSGKDYKNTKITEMFESDLKSSQTTETYEKRIDLPYNEETGRGDIGPEKPVNSDDSRREDIGRGDIGPEGFDDDSSDTRSGTINIPKPRSLTKENNNFTTDHTNKAESRENPSWFEEEQLNYQFDTANATFGNIESNTSWKRQYSDSSSKNQTNIQVHQGDFRSSENKHQYEEHIANQPNGANVNTSTKEKAPELPVGGQNPYQIQSSEKPSSTPDSSRDQEFQLVDSFSGEEGQGQLEQSNQNILQTWQQAENGKESVWGQQSESFMQISQQQEKAQTFGVGINDEQQNEGPLAEQFQRNSTDELDSIYMSNHKLPHYLPEVSKKKEDIQATPRIAEPTTTSKPGFWKNTKNKFLSWFKSN